MQKINEKIFLQHINNLTLTSEIVPDDSIKFNGIVKIIKNRTKYENILNDDGNLIYAAILNNIVIDENRNNIIVNEILKIYDENNENYCFVFSDRLTHLATLDELIKIKRNKDVWDNEKMESFAQILADDPQWFKSWDNTNVWYSYPLLYHGKLVGKDICPTR